MIVIKLFELVFSFESVLFSYIWIDLVNQTRFVILLPTEMRFIISYAVCYNRFSHHLPCLSQIHHKIGRTLGGPWYQIRFDPLKFNGESKLACNDHWQMTTRSRAMQQRGLGCHVSIHSGAAPCRAPMYRLLIASSLATDLNQIVNR